MESGRRKSLFTTEDKTDFWQATYCGWRNDNGHFYYREVEGEFTAEVVFSADYKAHYDQAGLMLRLGHDNWVKAGVEFAHGRAILSSVFTTNGVSDWAIGPQVRPADRVHLRLTLIKSAVGVQELDAGKFQTLRLGAFAATSNSLIGLMACSPTQGGLKVHFENFRAGPAVDFAGEV